MKIILIKTPYLYLFRTKTENAYPLGLAQIAACLRAASFEVELLDPENQGMNRKAIKDKLLTDKPEIVGFSCATANFDAAIELAKIAKGIGAKTILGGIHATSAYQEILAKNNEFDFIVLGEAEETIVELCNVMRAKDKDFKHIKGLAYKQGDNIVVTEKRFFVEQLDKFPAPQWELLDLGVYTLPDFIYPGKKGITLVSARGCPAHCIFCSVHLINGRNFRYFSARRIVDDIETLVNKFNIEFVAFRDDTFTVIKERVVDFCNLLLERNIKIRWYCLARANTVDLNLLLLMKKAGCERIAYGVESGSDKILTVLKKGMTVQQIRNAYLWTHQAGIKSVASLIFGNPGETRETMEQTLDLAIELDPDIAHFFVMAPLPGTELYEKYKNIYFSENIGNNQSSYGIYSMSNESSFHCGDLTYDDLKKQLIKANSKFYFRPHYVIKKIMQVKTKDDLKVLFNNGFALLKSMFLLNKPEANGGKTD